MKLYTKEPQRRQKNSDSGCGNSSTSSGSSRGSSSSGSSSSSEDLYKSRRESRARRLRALRTNSRQRSQQHWQQPECRRSPTASPAGSDIGMPRNRSSSSNSNRGSSSNVSRRLSAFGSSFLCWGVISLAFAGRVGWQRCFCSPFLSHRAQ